MRHWLVVFGFLLYSPAQFAQQADVVGEIRELLVQTYVEGIYVNRDENRILYGHQ
jgi:hypothetical protein